MENKYIKKENERYKKMVINLHKKLDQMTKIAVSKPTTINNSSVNNSSINNSTNNNLMVLNNQYPNAEILTKLKNYNNIFLKDGVEKIIIEDETGNGNDIEFEIIEDNNDSFVRDIIAYKRLNTLHEVLGDFLIENYVKEDKSLQSLHLTDSSRLKFVYTELKKNLTTNTIEWKDDPKGVGVTKIIIIPMLEYINSQVSIFTPLKI